MPCPVHSCGFSMRIPREPLQAPQTPSPPPPSASPLPSASFDPLVVHTLAMGCIHPAPAGQRPPKFRGSPSSFLDLSVPRAQCPVWESAPGTQGGHSLVGGWVLGYSPASGWDPCDTLPPGWPHLAAAGGSDGRGGVQRGGLSAFPLPVAPCSWHESPGAASVGTSGYTLQRSGQHQREG